MDSIPDTVRYCSVSKGNRTLYFYSGGEHEIEKLAALSLESTPPYHNWYFETMGKRTFGFLIEEGYVYFAIVDEGLGNPLVLKFLEHMRDEFKKVARKGSRGSFSGLSSINVQDQLLPVIRRLISSLDRLPENGNDWFSENGNDRFAETSSSENMDLSPSPSDINGEVEILTSTKAPLLGKCNKQEKKKKLKDHVIVMGDIELEEQRKSVDGGVIVDSTSLDSNNHGGGASSVSLQKDLGGSMRIRSSAQSIRKKWWRQVRIVLAIDAAVCLILVIIWMSICRGFGCNH